MKPTTSVCLIALVVSTGIFLEHYLNRPAVAHAQTACGPSVFTGSYGYTQSGYAYDAQGNIYIIASTGRMVADGNGGLTGSETVSFDGNILRRTYTGTYTMTEDCVGAVTLTFATTSAGAALHGDIVAVNNARQINFVQTDPNFIYSGVLTRQTQ